MINSLNQLQSCSPISLAASISSLCKWSALILALFATYAFFIRLRRNAPSVSSIPLLNDDDDCSDNEEEEEEEEEDEEDETASSSDSGDGEEEEGDAIEGRNGEIFRFGGSGDFLRRRSIGDLFSLAEIANSKSVVKLWDSLGLGLGFGFDDSESSDVISAYADDGDGIRPIPTEKPTTPAVSRDSPAVVFSAGESASGNLAVSIWDKRLRRRMPAVTAEWGLAVGKAVGVESGGVQKVYVRDDGRYSLTVGDVRNVRSPLENVNITESYVDSWWPNSFLLKI